MKKEELLMFLFGWLVSTFAYWYVGIISTCELIVCK